MCGTISFRSNICLEKHVFNGSFKTFSFCSLTLLIKCLITNRIIFEYEIYVGLQENTDGIKAGNVKEIKCNRLIYVLPLNKVYVFDLLCA